MLTKRVSWMLVSIVLGAFSACAAPTADEAEIDPDSVAVKSEAVSSQFVNCTESEIAIIRSAAEGAVTLGNQALSSLINNPNSDRLKYWFGTPTFTFNIRDTLRRAIQRIANNTITYECSPCGTGLMIAQVYPGMIDNYVSICCQFLNPAPAPTGYNRSAVLIHEMVHYDFPGDTGCEDREQGHNLAMNDSLAASRCAPNYMYFIENTTAPWSWSDLSQCRNL